MSVAALRTIRPEEYVPHELHRSERAWGESNCYIDVWIEVLHALGCEPYACLPFVLTIDWEGDQFTFFKPPHEELRTLYGVDVQELNVYKPILDNACEQLRLGRIVLTEADAFFLPDTAGTDYRTQHTKTTIGVQEIDREKRLLGYFHNASYHVLGDADFASLFRLDAPPDPTFMPLFAEFVRTDRVERLEAPELVQRSVALLRKQLARMPEVNPVSRFAEALRDDVERLKGEGLAAYHVYAFATIRQLGAAFELGAMYLRWLARNGEAGLEECAADLSGISDASKSLILKTARAVAAKKAVDLAPMVAEIETRWTQGTERLARRYGV
ncbi:MAG TPA: DUF1839 family protein [Polyangiaceae bacterium]